MSKDVIEVQGYVLESLPNALFKVELEIGLPVLAEIWENPYEFYKNSTGR